MLKGGYLPPVQNYHHGTTNRLTIPTPRILLVRTPPQGHQRLRSLFHIPLRTSTCKGTRHSTEHIHSLPPSNRWSYGMNQSVGRTIPKANHGEPRGLE